MTKLVAKVREGNKVKKVYDDPTTPYQRVLDPAQVGVKEKRKVRTIHAKLDVVLLKRQIDKMLDALAPTKAW